MRRYQRVRIPGGTYFFTVVLANRSSTLLTDRIEALREAFRTVRAAHPFETAAVAVLPDHLHAIWTLPDGDADYSNRWSLIKARFSRSIANGEVVSPSRERRRERGIWQRRFHEHAIRDGRDLQRHIDYIHWNPVKHGCVAKAIDWPHSSIHRYVREGRLTADWAAAQELNTLSFPE